MEVNVSEESKLPKCSFCGKNVSEVDCLIECGDVAICDECVEKSRDIIGYNRYIQTQKTAT